MRRESCLPKIIFHIAEHVRLGRMTGQDNMTKLLKDFNDKDKSNFIFNRLTSTSTDFFAIAAKQVKDSTE